MKAVLPHAVFVGLGASCDVSSLKAHGREGSMGDLAERGLEVSFAEIHDYLRAPMMPLILESPLGLDSFHFRN